MAMVLKAYAPLLKNIMADAIRRREITDLKRVLQFQWRIVQMLTNVSDLLYSKLTDQLTLTDDQRIAGRYGMEAAIYTIVSTAMLLIYGAILGELASTCVMIVVYYVNQTVGGGFHADTHMKCFLTMIVGLTLGIIVLKIGCVSLVIASIITGISMIVLWKIPLVLHRNKQFLESGRTILSRKSRMYLLIEFMLFIVMTFASQDTISAVSIGLLFAMISRVAGWNYTRKQIVKQAHG